jgi:glycosyltransferase involved in cell wall biosynthesis
MKANVLSAMPLKLAYVVTEDWAFYRHRLPMAKAAQAAGYEVHVLTRVDQRRAEIEREGFTLHPLAWQRSALSPLASARSVLEVRRILRAIRPTIVHNVAVKPAVIGSLAARGLPGIGVVNSINGLGSAFLPKTAKDRLMKRGLEAVLSRVLSGARTRVIVQNPEDREAILALGIPPGNVVLVPGSGVDTDALLPLPEPPGPVKAAYVGRMLEDKGLRALMDAHRLLRQRGQGIELLLAGEPDPGNPHTITEAELLAWGSEPGVTWLGHVEQIRDVWAQSHIAVLPSRREGLPKSLLEAAAFGRPLVATDAPGCREVAIAGETGLLAPIDDAAALADALATLARSPAMRARMGANARRLAVERFSSADIGRQTVATYRALS